MSGDAPVTPPRDPLPADAAAGNGAAPADPAAALHALMDQGDALRAERDEARDRLLRALADAENLRRRAAREAAEARAYGVTKLAADVVALVDNLRRAIEAVPAEARAAEGPLRALVEGVELSERDLARALERHGVRRVDPVGERFDPHRHQAMFEAQDPSVPAGTVTVVMQAGYVIGEPGAERVLRPALVGVARGGPKAAPAAEEPAGAGASGAGDAA